MARSSAALGLWLITCLATWLHAAGCPRAEAQSSSEPATRGRLWESPRERDARLRQEAAAKVSESLGWLEGVRRAQVHLGEDPRARDIDRAAVVLEVEPGADRARVESQARRLVAAAFSELRPETIEVVVATRGTGPPKNTAREAAFVKVGPFRVAQEAAAPLRLLLTVLLMLNAVLAAALIGLWRLRHR